VSPISLPRARGTALHEGVGVEQTMSDTVWVIQTWSVARFWGGTQGDCIQITSPTEYVQLTLAEFRELVRLVEANVEKTKDAWWHLL